MVRYLSPSQVPLAYDQCNWAFLKASLRIVRERERGGGNPLSFWAICRLLVMRVHTT